MTIAMNTVEQTGWVAGMLTGQLIRYGLIVGSNVVLVVYLLLDGVSAFEIMNLAAAESLLAAALFVVARAVQRARTERGGKRDRRRHPIMKELVTSLFGVVGVFGFIMTLFPAAAWYVAPERPAGPLFLANPAFRDAGFFIGLALLGQFLANVVDALRGRFVNFDRVGLGVGAHLLIGVIAAAFGSAAVLLLEMPAMSLLILLAAKTAADLLIARYLGRGLKP